VKLILYKKICRLIRLVVTFAVT